MMSPQKVVYQVIPVIPNIYIYMGLFRDFGETLFLPHPEHNSNQDAQNRRSPVRAMASGLVWVVKLRSWEPNIWDVKVAVGIGCHVNEASWI